MDNDRISELLMKKNLVDSIDRAPFEYEYETNIMKFSCSQPMFTINKLAFISFTNKIPNTDNIKNICKIYVYMESCVHIDITFKYH